MLSGYLKANLIILGLLSCLFVTLAAIRLKIYSSHHERLRFNLRLPFYVPWLLKEIIKSNLHVARCILSGSQSMQPQLVSIKFSQKTNTGIAVHANSIILTPGTISIDITDTEIVVHALTDHTAKGVINGDIDKQVQRLEDRIT